MHVIEYENVTDGPLKGGGPSFQGGANAPPRPPPLKETLICQHSFCFHMHLFHGLWPQNLVGLYENLVGLYQKLVGLYEK